MVKLSYTGRKAVGLKVAQSVSRDLRKRIPPGSGAKAATRDPRVEIDLTGKELTDEGFEVVVGDLIECIQYCDEDHPHGIAQLTELSLKGNCLTVASMAKLGLVVSLSADALSQLDISDNNISVVSSSDRDTWRSFLEAFQGCYMLKKVDFSGNPFGGAGFDVLSRVYAQSKLDFIELPKSCPKQYTSTESDGENGLVESLNKVHLNKENLKPSNSRGKPVAQSIRESLDDVADDLDYASTRGLRSVPYFILSNTCTTNAGAFHLWNMVMSHREPATLLRYLPPGRSVEPPDVKKCSGIVHTTNKEMTPLGKRLLELGYESRMQAPHCDEEGFDLTDNEEAPEFEVATNKQARTKRAVEMDRVKNRILLDVLKTDGLHSVEIWRTAFKMMVTARAILLDDAVKTTPVQNIDEPVPEERALTFTLDQLDTEFPTLKAAMESSKEGSSKKQRSRACSASIHKPQNKGSSAVTKRFRLPPDLWRTIIAYAIEDSDALDYQQQMQVIRYASDWQSIKQELRINGGAEHEQIWKILSSMDCLSYATAHVG